MSRYLGTWLLILGFVFFGGICSATTQPNGDPLVQSVDQTGLQSMPVEATSTPNEDSPPEAIATPSSATSTMTNEQIQDLWRSAGLSGKLTVADFPGNGNRPAAIYLPPTLDPSKPVKLVIFFHGHYWNIGDQFQKLNVLARLKDLETKNPNTVFVTPQADKPPFSYWMKPPEESFAAFSSQAMKEAARLAGVSSLEISQRIVSAHSGGGLALRTAVQTNQFVADKIELLDANYNDWGMVLTKWSKSFPQGKRPPITTWNTPGSTATHDQEILKEAPDIVTVNKSAVPHNDIPGKYLGTTIDQ
ncbi:MAG: hypothetical protein HQM08_19120 [Candidatus Riflebacteria bacterium]|nr:hypothetical protein [Candidatus Riflebacteria bacterium]